MQVHVSWYAYPRIESLSILAKAGYQSVSPTLRNSPIDIHLLGELALGVLADADRGELT